MKEKEIYEAFEKVLRSIDGCIFSEQLDACGRMVSNFERLYEISADKALTGYLSHKIKERRKVIGWMQNV